MNKLLASALVSIGFITMAASPVMAQTPNSPTNSGAQTHNHARHQHQHRALGTPSERVEARLAYIKTALKITDAQQPQWNAFADTLRKQAAARDKQFQERRANNAQGHGHMQVSVIERMERQQQRLAAAAQMLGERLAVQKPLYAMLTVEQKQVANRVLSPRGGNGKNRHHGARRTA